MHDYKKHETSLICPNCGNEFANLLEKNIALEYTCKQCNHHVYTYIYKHEIFYTKEKMM
jgi:DNA-directed RNA polymerase subunit RPC12/RpoP